MGIGFQFAGQLAAAHGDIPMSVRAMKAGAVEFLTKPGLLTGREQARKIKERSGKPHAEAWLAYARMLLVEGDLGEAAKQIERAKQIDPQSRDVHFESGRLLLKKGALREAAQEGETALRLLGEVTDRRVQIWLADRGDRWSIACTCLILTFQRDCSREGRHDFWGRNSGASVAQIRSRPPAAPRSWPANRPRSNKILRSRNGSDLVQVLAARSTA